MLGHEQYDTNQNGDKYKNSTTLGDDAFTPTTSEDNTSDFNYTHNPEERSGLTVGNGSAETFDRPSCTVSVSGFEF